MFTDTRGTSDEFIGLGETNIKIRPNDELLITVTSSQPEATAYYNLPLANPAKRDVITLSSQPQIQTYIVDTKGNIDFPILGSLHVEGLTTTQLKEELTRRISADVKDPVVRVELVNFTVNVIGEVAHPGRVPVHNERFSILDALSSAGSLTEFGDRTNVLLIREEDGKAQYHYIDLTKSDVVSSPYYYLQQNDVVMVSPSATRESNARYDTNNSYKIQVVSAIVSGASVIASLIIALTVK